MTLEPLSTQIVGSYVKPPWLIGSLREHRRFDPAAAWAPADDVLAEAQRDAARLAIYEQERAGMRIVTDGEQFRHRYDTTFLLRMTGIDTDNLAQRQVAPNEIASRVSKDWTATEAEDNQQAARLTGVPHMADNRTSEHLAFARSVANRPVKATVVGPFTASMQLSNEYYPDTATAVLALAGAINEELRALQDAGADVLQIDEPAIHSWFSAARDFATEAIDTALAGIDVATVVHVCYGYPDRIEAVDADEHYADCLRAVARSAATAISVAYEQPGHQPVLLEACGNKHVLLGLLDLGTKEIDSLDHVERRLREAMEVVPADRLHPSVDCGMWFLPREVGYAKLAVLGAAADRVRK